MVGDNKAVPGQIEGLAQRSKVMSHLESPWNDFENHGGGRQKHSVGQLGPMRADEDRAPLERDDLLPEARPVERDVPDAIASGFKPMLNLVEVGDGSALPDEEADVGVPASSFHLELVPSPDVCRAGIVQCLVKPEPSQRDLKLVPGGDRRSGDVLKLLELLGSVPQLGRCEPNVHAVS